MLKLHTHAHQIKFCEYLISDYFNQMTCKLNLGHNKKHNPSGRTIVCVFLLLKRLTPNRESLCLELDLPNY